MKLACVVLQSDTPQMCVSPCRHLNFSFPAKSTARDFRNNATTLSPWPHKIITVKATIFFHYFTHLTQFVRKYDSVIPLFPPWQLPSVDVPRFILPLIKELIQTARKKKCPPSKFHSRHHPQPSIISLAIASLSFLPSLSKPP